MLLSVSLAFRVDWHGGGSWKFALKGVKIQSENPLLGRLIKAFIHIHKQWEDVIGGFVPKWTCNANETEKSFLFGNRCSHSHEELTQIWSLKPIRGKGFTCKEQKN